MCSAGSVIHLFIYACGLALMVFGAKSQGRFNDRLRVEHELKWRELIARRVRFHDGDPHYVATQYYLWSGAYKLLGDPSLDRLARCVLVSMAALFLLVGVWFVVEYRFPGASVTACFGALRR